jgi:hypothetical protein
MIIVIVELKISNIVHLIFGMCFVEGMLILLINVKRIFFYHMDSHEFKKGINESLPRYSLAMQIGHMKSMFCCDVKI